MMTPDPIDEIKQIRHELGVEAGFDVHRIFDQLREQQAASDRTYVAAPKTDSGDHKATQISQPAGPS